MSIPKYDEIRIHALRHLLVNEEVKLKDFETPLAQVFGLTEEEIAQVYESGNARIFYDRISWALSYLRMTGLVDKPRRGYYKINSLGREMEAKPEEIEPYIKQKMADIKQRMVESNKTNQVENGPAIENELDLTPQEQLYQSFEKIRNSVQEDILDTVISKTPRAFEHLVVTLMEKMGYGGQVKGAGTVTQASNDGGIDGIVKEDVLGLGRIHIQAKRYARDNTIGRDEIQKFVGAIAVAQSNKGVFITTSSYSKAARAYAGDLNGNTTVVLIDGPELAQYIYDYNLGMQVDQVIELKKLDSDFWDAIKDTEIVE